MIYLMYYIKSLNIIWKQIYNSIYKYITQNRKRVIKYFKY